MHPQQSQPAAGTVLVVVGPATLVEVVVDVDVVVDVPAQEPGAGASRAMKRPGSSR